MARRNAGLEGGNSNPVFLVSSCLGGKSKTAMEPPSTQGREIHGRSDFRSKMGIAAKEARECHYWLRLARDGKVLGPEVVAPLVDDVIGIKKILTAIVKSATG